MKNIIPLILFVSICISISINADVPDYINFQGKLTDPSGVAIEGTYSTTFEIYDAATGGSLLWSETHPSLSIEHGLFDVILGSLDPLDLDFSSQYWVEITIETETLSPRLPLTSTPYSYRAAIADSLAGGAGTTQNDVDVPLTLTGDFTVISGETEVHGALDDLDAAVATNQSDIADNAADITAHVSADGDLSNSNELITDFTWDDGTDLLTVTEAATPRSVTIENEADDLSDNIINDLGNVNATPASGQILGWNGSQWIAVDDATGAATDDQNLTFTGSASPYTLDIEDGTDVTFSSGTGITLSRSTNQLIIANSAPDQSVSIGSGTGISVSGSYPNFTVTNTAPDQTVSISSGTGISVSGSYPNFTVTNSSPWTSSSNSYIQNQIATDQSADFRIDGDGIIGGYVGIGTTSPAHKLHLYGTSNNASDVYSQTDAGRIIKHWFVNAGRSWSIGQLGTTVAPNYQFRITDETSGTSRITINPDGNIGISNNAPASELDVSGVIRANNYRDNAGGNLLRSSDGSVSISEDVDGSWDLTVTGIGADNDWEVSGSNVYSGISPAPIGNIGIGTSTPGRKLDVVGDTELNGDLYFPVGLSTIDFPVEGMRISPNWGMSNGISIGNTSWNASVAILDNSVWSGDAMRLWGHIDMDENEIYAIDYLNFNDTKGSTGYGIRDNAGTVEYKNSGGSWTPITGGGGVGGSGSVNMLAVWSDASNITYYSDLEWDDTNNRLYFGSVEYLQDQGANEIGFYGDIEPTTDASYNLGNSDMAWNQLYIDGAIYLNGSAGSAGQVLTSNGTGDPTWSTVAGGSGLWQDDGSNIRPVEYDGFRIYDNTTGYVGLWFTSSTGVNTSAAANLYHANSEHAYLAYDDMCGLQGDSDTENGVQGISSTGTADYAGVYGENSNSGSNVYGIYGLSQGYAGVLGVGPDYGLWGKGNGTIEPNYGAWLYGTSYGLKCSGDLGFWSSTNRIQIGSDYGSVGEVLTSNGTSGIYWGTAGGGGSSYWTDNSTYISPNDNSNWYIYDAGQTYGIYYNSNSHECPIYVYDSDATGDGYQEAAISAVSMTSNDANAGTDFTRSALNAAIYGYAYWGDNYTAGVAGFSFLEDNYSSGVFGGYSYGGNVWGALAYQNSSSTDYGGYFYGGYTSGSGRRRPENPDSHSRVYDDGEAHVTCGIGVWGDLFGADIHGEIYGSFTEGGRYSSYDHGDRYCDGLDIHLQDIGEEQMAIMYTAVSEDATVTASGIGKLHNGRAQIIFDEKCSSLLSPDERIVVSLTPIGESNGLNLTTTSVEGFTVAENDDGNSNIEFTWVAYGVRRGYENPKLAEEVTNTDYVQKIQTGQKADGNMEGDAPGLYYENEAIYNERHSSTYADEEFNASRQTEKEKITSESRRLNEIFYDIHGAQIPPKWVDTLKAAGYPMFTYEEVMERRLENYLSDAKEIRKGEENTKHVPYEIELLENGIHKYTDVETGEVFFKNAQGLKVTREGEVIYGDGQAKPPRIYELHPEADPTNQENLNNEEKD